MKTLTTPLSTQTAASQAGWTELYDFYLPSPIATPFGTTATLRITPLPGGIQFFTPKVSPEPSGTQGNAQSYQHWPIQRQTINGSSKFTNDKLTITASNVTGDWATMLSAVDWDAVNVVVRKISTTISNPTADDCTVIFSGTIDSVKVTLEQLQFTVSNDLGTFQTTAPRENMHANCRFQWADDQCTMIRFHPNFYKTKTCGSGCTTTDILSYGLTEDTGSKSGYGTDLITSASITTSSAQVGFSSVSVGWVTDGDGNHTWFTLSGHTLSLGQAFTWNSPVPTGIGKSIVAGQPYYVTSTTDPVGTTSYSFADSPGGTNIRVSTTNGSVNATDFSGSQVKAGSSSYWAIDPSSGDWGTLTQGYWQIPDTQAGLANGALKPWVQIDFGSGTPPQPTLWRITPVNTGDSQDVVRLIQFVSSPLGSSWKFESYFEVPPNNAAGVGGTYDVLIPNASSVRYWRVAVRNRWSSDLRTPMFKTISAYAYSRHYWQAGRITFTSSTTTAALRNVSRVILESYAGELICAPLPVAPVAGDTFVIERGCLRTFNACCARKNTENFGGFNTLPYVQMTVNP